MVIERLKRVIERRRGRVGVSRQTQRTTDDVAEHELVDLRAKRQEAADARAAVLDEFRALERLIRRE